MWKVRMCVQNANMPILKLVETRITKFYTLFGQNRSHKPVGHDVTRRHLLYSLCWGRGVNNLSACFGLGHDRNVTSIMCELYQLWWKKLCCSFYTTFIIIKNTATACLWSVLAYTPCYAKYFFWTQTFVWNRIAFPLILLSQITLIVFFSFMNFYVVKFFLCP